MRRAALLPAAGAALLAAGCGGGAQPADPALAPDRSWARPVLDEALAVWEAHALPAPEPEMLQEVRELLDLATTGRRARGRAWSRLDELDAAARTAALLELVEGRELEDALRPWAYEALRLHGAPAMIPRLTLRLKYEKNWSANVDLARALLAHGSGAGLDALVRILETEDEDPAVAAARVRAAEALSALPPQEGWAPGADFAADWQRLLEVRDSWARDRRLPDTPPTPPTPGATAELWRMVAQFRSQPLRPVDDARFAFVRLPAWSYGVLAEAVRDEERYVREHALQTLSWIGRPAARWSARHDAGLVARVQQVLGDPASRARAAQALGALGDPRAGEALMRWLRHGDFDVRTAAADALLRAAGPGLAQPVAAFLAEAPALSPEARYSLGLYLAAVRGDGKADAPQGLDEAERQRRERWAASRR